MDVEMGSKTCYKKREGLEVRLEALQGLRQQYDNDEQQKQKQQVWRAHQSKLMMIEQEERSIQANLAWIGNEQAELEQRRARAVEPIEP